MENDTPQPDTSQETKTFLLPKHRRLGAETLNYVVTDGRLYWLGTYYNRQPDCPKEWDGEGQAYNACERIQISKHLYDAFIAESLYLWGR